MAGLRFGIAEGLTVDAQYDKRINDLRFNEEAKVRAEKAKEAEVKMYADDFAYENAMNTFDHGKVKTHAQGKIKEIGAFLRSNPGWKSNIGQRAQYAQMVKEMRDGEDYRRGVTTDQSFKDMAAYTKNPKNANITNSNAWVKIQEQKANYLKFGNQDGQDAFNNEGAKAFAFIPPQELVDINVKGLDIGRKLGSRERATGGGFGASVTRTPTQFITDAATAELSGPDAWAWRQAYSDLDVQSKNFYENNGGITSFTFDAIEKGTDVSRDFGARPLQGSGSGFGGGDPNFNYLSEIESKRAGTSPYARAISPIVNGQFNSSPSDNMQFAVRDAEGNLSYENLVGYYGTPVDAITTGNFNTLANGQKMVELQITVPLQETLIGPSAPFESGATFGGTFGNDPDDYITKESYLGIAAAEFDSEKDGDKNFTGNAKLRVWVKARTGQAERNNYNKLSSGQKNANQIYQPEKTIIQTSDQLRVLEQTPIGGRVSLQGVIHEKRSDGKFYPVQ